MLFDVFSQPHLHTIVNRSMELAMSAKEPYNYFLLLRALFRSIGGGSHDLLYQEFLPLLPNLLQGRSSEWNDYKKKILNHQVWKCISVFFVRLKFSISTLKIMMYKYLQGEVILAILCFYTREYNLLYENTISAILDFSKLKTLIKSVHCTLYILYVFDL